MKTWENYKDYVKKIDPDGKKDIEEAENIAIIIGTMIERRNELGLSQRDLAHLCGVPQSSIARIESLQIIPNLSTLVKILLKLNLKLETSVIDTQL